MVGEHLYGVVSNHLPVCPSTHHIPFFSLCSTFQGNTVSNIPHQLALEQTEFTGDPGKRLEGKREDKPENCTPHSPCISSNGSGYHWIIFSVWSKFPMGRPTKVPVSKEIQKQYLLPLSLQYCRWQQLSALANIKVASHCPGPSFISSLFRAHFQTSLLQSSFFGQQNSEPYVPQSLGHYSGILVVSKHIFEKDLGTQIPRTIVLWVFLKWLMG